VDVVEADDERARGGDPVQEVAQGAVRAVAVGRGRRDLGAQRGQQRRQGIRIGEAQPRQPPLAELRQMSVERLGPECVRQIALELRRARPHHLAAVRRRGEVREEPRLADAGLALDGDDSAGPHAEGFERVGDRVALCGPADQRRLIHARDSRLPRSVR
jgi:hypothetical protein